MGMCVVFFLTHTLTVVLAAKRVLRFDLGLYTTVVLFDDALTPAENYKFVKTYQNASHLYLVQVHKDHRFTDRPVCENVDTTPVAVRALGCDGVNFVESCAKSPQDAVTNRDKLLANFLYSWRENECIRGGGDRFSCVGPVFAIFPNTKIRVLPATFTNATTLYRAQSFAIFTNIGPRGQMKGVTFLDMTKPDLYVLGAANCTDTTGARFNGTFTLYFRDAIAGMFINETQIFKRLAQATHQRVVRTRDGHLALGEVSGTDTFRTLFRSSAPLPPAWYDLQDVRFTNGCTVSFQTPSSFALELIPPARLTDLNFFQNQFPPVHFQTRECSFHVGGYDANRNLKFPYTSATSVGGGRTKFALPGSLLYLPMEVRPDPNMRHYTLSCADVWPKQVAFFDYGLGPDDNGVTDGNTQPHFVVETGLCYFPFLDVLGLRSAEATDNARDLNCFKQGGFTYGQSKSHCAREIQVSRCKLGWYYFNQYCYYKFDPIVDSKYKSSAADAGSVCAQLDPLSTVVASLPVDLRAFLKERFVFIDRKGPAHPHRVNVGGRRCIAFDYIENALDQADDVAHVYDISCLVPAFPLCRYHHTRFRLPYSEFSLHWDTVRTLRDGQEGAPASGHELECECMTGFCSSSCETVCCPTRQLAGNDTLSRWYIGKCLAFNRGWCEEYEPRTCQCAVGYGPKATFGVGQLYEYACFCPTTPRQELFDTSAVEIRINGVTYANPEPSNVVCGGRDRGECVVEGNLGVCRCDTRLDLRPGSTYLTQEPNFDGLGCEAMVPIAPNRGHHVSIITRMCNGNGFTCPSGLSFREQILDETTRSLVGRQQCLDPRTKELLGGCVCFPGYTGLSCTCDSPRNVFIPQTLFEETPTQVYGKLALRTTVRRVVIVGECPILPTSIRVRDGSGDQNPRACYSMSFNNRTWYCDSIPGDFIILAHDTFSPLNCLVEVFSDWFHPCGNNTNPFAGAFTNNEFHDDWAFHRVPQSAKFAVHGCITSSCFCDANHGGKLCRAGKSGFRYDFDMSAIHAQYCGEDYLPPRGWVDPDTGYCKCAQRARDNSVFVSRFVGDSCELEEVYDVARDAYVLCNGEGSPMRASFPAGYCEFDLLDWRADPLVSPNSLVNDVFNLSDTSAFVLLNDTILRTDGDDYWFVPRGARLIIEGLKPNSPNRTTVSTPPEPWVFLPHNVSFLFDSTSASARLVRPVVRVLALRFTCEEAEVGVADCYETVTRTYVGSGIFGRSRCTGPALSPAELNYNLSYECLVGWSFAEIDPIRSDETLETGLYHMSEFPQGLFAQAGNVLETGFQIGLLDASDPLDRLLAEVALKNGVTASNQFAHLYGDHARIRGRGFGIFWDALPEVKFSSSSERWLPETQYKLLGSVLGNVVCLQTDTQELDRDAYDVALIDDVFRSLFTSEGGGSDIEREVSFPNDTASVVEVFSMAGGMGPQPALVPREPRSPTATHRGYFLRVPSGYLILREFFVRVPSPRIEGFMAYGPTGRLCGTYYPSHGRAAFDVNETVRIGGDCEAFMQHQPLHELFGELRGNSTNETWIEERIAARNPRFEYLLIVATDSAPNFTKSHFSLVGRDEPYEFILRGIKTKIKRDLELPLTSFFRTRCMERRRLREVVPLNTSSPAHQRYLYDYWVTHLAPRRCTDDWQCELQARDPQNYRCVRDDEDIVRGWRGGAWTEGDGDDDGGIYGDEGGCVCRENAKQPCTTCLRGYGPAKFTLGWQAYVRFFNVTGGTASVPRYCHFPYDARSTRPTKVCGGYGRPVFENHQIISSPVVVFPDERVRRCRQLVVEGGTVYQLVEAVGEMLDFILYRSENDVLSEIRVIRKRLFLRYNGTFVTELSFSTIAECRSLVHSPTHKVGAFVNGVEYELVDSNSDFFVSKLSAII